MAWYGRRRSGEPRVGARAVVVGLGIAMVGVLAIQSSSGVRQGIDVSRRSMDGVTASLASWSAGITGWSFGWGRSQDDVKKIEDLQAQVRDLQRYKDLTETMTLRMKRYEEILDIVGETQGKAVTARVVAEENGPFAATRIANAGAANGVREGFAAINENGLVGRVIRVGEYTSRILLLTDYNSRIPVMGLQSGDRALLEGDTSGARLVQPETPDKIIPGEIWITSGDDGKLPLGVQVGRARKGPDSSEWRIDLAMEGGPVDFVRLVPPPDFATPEDAPPLTGVQANTDRSLTTSISPLPPAATSTPGQTSSQPARLPAQAPKPPAAAPAPAQTPKPPAGQGGSR